MAREYKEVKGKQVSYTVTRTPSGAVQLKYLDHRSNPARITAWLTTQITDESEETMKRMMEGEDVPDDPIPVAMNEFDLLDLDEEGKPNFKRIAIFSRRYGDWGFERLVDLSQQRRLRQWSPDNKEDRFVPDGPVLDALYRCEELLSGAS